MHNGRFPTDVREIQHANKCEKETKVMQMPGRKGSKLRIVVNGKELSQSHSQWRFSGVKFYGETNGCTASGRRVKKGAKGAPERRQIPTLYF